MSPRKSATLSKAAEVETGVAAPAAAPAPPQSDINELTRRVLAGEFVEVFSPDGHINYAFALADHAEGVTLWWRPTGQPDHPGLIYNDPMYLKAWPPRHPAQRGFQQAVFHNYFTYNTATQMVREGGIQALREMSTRAVLAAIFAGKNVHAIRCGSMINQFS